MAKTSLKNTNGTNKADVIEITKNVTVKALAGNDTVTIKKGSSATVYGGAGGDKISVNKGSKHAIYGEAGADTIIVGKNAGSGLKVYGGNEKFTLKEKDKFVINGGNKNYFYGGKGVDTFTVNAGKNNYLYGKAGSDVFVIGASSTGTATVKDFTVKDKVKVDGTISSITSSGKNNMVIKGGKNGKAALTLEKAKSKTFTVTDSLGSYKVKSSNVALTLDKFFKGTLTAPSFITTIDARKLELEKNSYGNGIQRDVYITGNAKANTIYVATINGGTYQGGAGADTITVTSGDNHIIYGDDETGKRKGNDNIVIKGGTGHTIYGGAGKDTITVAKGITKSKYTIEGGDDNDIIEISSGGDRWEYPSTVNGGNGNDTITLNETVNGYFTISGGSGGDTIDAKGGSNHTIYGDSGIDHITLYNGIGSSITVNGGDDKDYIVAKAGNGTINGDAGDDEITLEGNASKFTINGGAGTDAITINAGNRYLIDGGEDDDIIIFNKDVGDGSWETPVYGGNGSDEITIYGGNGHYVYGDDKDGDLTGDDKITVNAGSNHRIYSGNGNDKITLNDVSSTVYGEAGDDVITVNSGTHTIYGGEGANTYNIYNGTNAIVGGNDIDTFNIYGGTIWSVKSAGIAAGGGNDLITITGGEGVGNNWEREIKGEDGEDIINVSGTAENYRLNGGLDKDTITISAGSNHRVYNAGGDDIIKINAGAGGYININGSDTGSEHVEIYGGSGHTVSLGNGANEVIVGNNVHISSILTGNDVDKITVKDGASVNNGKNQWDNRSIRSGAGNDIITIEATAGNKTEISAESGDDKIYIYGGNEHSIFTGGGADTIVITGGENHYIELGQDSNDLEIGVKATTRTSRSTIKTVSGSSDFITINWSEGKNNGTYQINSVYDTGAQFGDKLTIVGATRDDFDYSIDGNRDKKKLTLSSKDGYGYIEINDWLITNNSATAAFSQYGITFVNGGTKDTYNYADINTRLNV